MIANEMINHMIPPLKPSDAAKKAVLWMEELRLNQLPVVEDGAFQGLISEDIILEDNDIDKLVSGFELIGKDCVVGQNAHFYNILKMASDNEVDLVGVIDDKNEYAGIITVQDIMTSFAQTAAVQVPGGIIILSIDQVDYSLSEISRLVEENEAKILSSSVKSDSLDHSRLKLTLKINKQDLTHIAATLERFGYKIISRFQETIIQESDKEKIDMLFKYLNI